MPSSREILQRAVQAARAGRKTEARDLLVELVEIEPRNEMAWMWLSGLVDSLDDKITACENVLTINPDNDRVCAYLTQLQQQQASALAEKNRETAKELYSQAKKSAEQKDWQTAFQFAQEAVARREDYEDAWLLLGRVSPDIDQRIMALEKAAELNPANTRTTSALEQARYLKAHPLSAATRLEQLGRYEEAIRVYEGLAAKTKNSRDFDHIYRQIIRIEGLKKENIRHVAPTSSIARLTVTWPLLYLSLAFVQMGLNPFRHPTFYSWLGIPLVIAGSFLLSLAEVRSRHIIWQKLFSEHGDGSTFARWVTATAGWLLVLIPIVLLLLDSLNRLRNFKIPLMPF